TGALSIAEAPGTLAFDAAAETLGRDIGVPLVGAVAEHVQAAQVDHLLETELVAQRAAGFEPVAGVDHDPDLAARLRDLDHRLREARLQRVRETRRGHQPASGCLAKVELRRIFFCSCRMP